MLKTNTHLWHRATGKHKTKTKTILRKSEMKTLKSIAGNSLRDRVRSAKIRETWKVEDVIRRARKRRRYWRDHVEKTDPKGLTKIVLTEIQRVTPIGRPPKR